MRPERAEAIALLGLAYLAADAERLGPFLAQTGMGPQDLASQATQRDLQVSVLDWLLGNESLLLAFAADNDIKPETVLPARHVLAGEISDSG